MMHRLEAHTHRKVSEERVVNMSADSVVMAFDPRCLQGHMTDDERGTLEVRGL